MEVLTRGMAEGEERFWGHSKMVMRQLCKLFGASSNLAGSTISKGKGNEEVQGACG